MNKEKNSTLVNVADFGKYDKHRYSKPWLAKLKGIPNSVKLGFDFIDGAFVEKEDGSGTLMGYLSEGDYIAYGQKDFRGNNSVAWYGIYQNGQFTAVSKPTIVRTLAVES